MRFRRIEGYEHPDDRPRDSGDSEGEEDRRPTGELAEQHRQRHCEQSPDAAAGGAHRDHRRPLQRRRPMTEHRVHRREDHALWT